MRRWTAAVLVALMTVLGATPGLADEPVADGRAVVDVTHRQADHRTDREMDLATAPKIERLTPTMQQADRRTDRLVDRDRHRCVDRVTDRRCIDDRHPHVNLRHLIQRLIHAGEWEKLFRLLHRLGIV